MIDISPAGLAGAAIGTVIAAVAYRWIVVLVERGLREQQRSEGRTTSEALEAPVLLRLLLATDIFVFAGLGYWLGATFWN
jgi:hypothetical protein